MRQLSGLRLPANITFTNGDGSIAVGRHFATGFMLDGIVKSIDQEGEHIVVTFEGGGQFILYGSGMYGEVLPTEAKRKPKEPQ